MDPRRQGWKTKDDKFRVQRMNGRFLLTSRGSKTISLSEDDLFDLVMFLEDVCDAVEETT
jgi:hypothetical protein